MQETFLDIDVTDTHNKLTIGILDISNYPTGLPVSNATLEISPPGFNRTTQIFTPRALNILNSNIAGITNSCTTKQLIPLPDGIWKLRYSIKPNDTVFIERVFLRTTLLNCKYQDCFIKAYTSEKYNITNKEKILDIHLLIEGAICAANEHNLELSMLLYNKASELLDFYCKSCCKKCTH